VGSFKGFPIFYNRIRWQTIKKQGENITWHARFVSWTLGQTLLKTWKTMRECKFTFSHFFFDWIYTKILLDWWKNERKKLRENNITFSHRFSVSFLKY